MSIDFSPTRRIVILVGLLVFAILGFAVLTLERARTPDVSAPVRPAAHHVPTAKPPATHHARAAAVKLSPGLPAPIRYALLRHRSVVVAVHGAGDVDAAAVAEARRGASLAHTTFISLDIRRARYATALAGFDDSIANPAVIVVRRPGVVVKSFPGFHDSQVVAQAAHDAR